MTSFPRRFSRLCALALLALLNGCALWRWPAVPMPTQLDRAACAAPADTLLVLLPGSYSEIGDFAREGFIAAVRERRLAVDVLATDAHLGYYADRSLVDRLTADVIAPARAGGYRAVWLVGISIGAFGAAIQADAVPAGIRGVVAIAPYLGSRQACLQVRHAGGLAAWQAPGGELPDEDIDRRVWRWLQRTAAGQAGGDAPRLFLAYGEGDRFAASDRLLAAALPPQQVLTLPGGHDWPVWSALWRQLLPRLPLPADASCSAGG